MMKTIKSPVSILVCLFGLFFAKYFLLDINEKNDTPVAVKEEVIQASDGTSALASETSVKAEYNFAELFPSVEEMLKERSFGSDNAPVVLRVFSSYTCGHCGKFFIDTVPKLLENEVAQGKLKIILEDYPYDAASVKATMIVKCSNPENYGKIAENVYKSVDKWYDKSKFEEVMLSFKDDTGLDAEKIKACLAHAELREKLRLKVEKVNDNYEIHSTPTLVYRKSIRNFVETGSVPYNRVKSVVESLIKNEDPS